MKTKTRIRKQAARPREPQPPEALTLMAVQEKLGLFSKEVPPAKEHQAAHDYLEIKPLGLI